MTHLLYIDITLTFRIKSFKENSLTYKNKKLVGRSVPYNQTILYINTCSVQVNTSIVEFFFSQKSNEQIFNEENRLFMMFVSCHDPCVLIQQILNKYFISFKNK